MKAVGAVLAGVALASSSPAAAQDLLLVQGEQVFNRSCATSYCHGPKGAPAGAPRLSARGFDQTYIENTLLAVYQARPCRHSPEVYGGQSWTVLSPTWPTSKGLSIGQLAGQKAPAGARPSRKKFSPPTPSGAGSVFGCSARLGRCSTCHEVNGIGIPVATPIASVPVNVEALRLLAIPSVRTAIFESQSMPALLLSNGSRGIVFYDLTTAPPVLHTAQPGTVTWREGSDWRHSPFTKAYNDFELEFILAYLRSTVQP